LGVNEIPAGMTLEVLRDAQLQSLRQANSSLHESVPTTITGIPAWQFVYTSEGLRALDVLMVRGNEVFMFVYRSQPEKYFKFLPIVEQMIASVEFLP
jgi:hypothetical protein